MIIALKKRIQKALIMKRLFPVLIGLFMLLSCSQEQKNVFLPDPDDGGLTLPDGFSALVVADELGNGRHITVNDNGDIYVSLRQHSENKGIVCLRDTSEDGKADIIEYTGEHTGTGIKLHKGYLYFGSDTAIVRYPMTEGELLPGNNWQMIARGFRMKDNMKQNQWHLMVKEICM